MSTPKEMGAMRQVWIGGLGAGTPIEIGQTTKAMFSSPYFYLFQIRLDQKSKFKSNQISLDQIR